jgi:hypothetical protein
MCRQVANLTASVSVESLSQAAQPLEDTNSDSAKGEDDGDDAFAYTGEDGAPPASSHLGDGGEMAHHNGADVTPALRSSVAAPLHLNHEDIANRLPPVGDGKS